MTNHWKRSWRTPVRPVLLAAAVLFAAQSGGTGFAQAQVQPSQPVRPAQSQAPKPKPPAQKPAQAPTPSAPGPAAGSGDGSQPQLLGQFGEWGAYTASPGGRKVCFALAKPAKAQTEPANRPRDPTYLFISSRPTERVRDEISVMFGYPFKPNTDASIEIGGASFSMYTQADGGWIKNAAEEPRLVETMRKAPDMTVKGVSVRGTASADIYSLKGLAQALDRLAQECR
jgi:hypothetical protein